MVLKIYKGDELYERGEREQLKELVEYLEGVYLHAVRENAYLLVNPMLGERYRQIDCIYYRRGKIIILELKNIHGKYCPTTDGVTPWKVEKDGKMEEFRSRYISPFNQVKLQRSKLNEYMRRYVYNIPQDDKNNDQSLTKKLGKLIMGWVITSSDSEVSEYDNICCPWFKTFPIGRQMEAELLNETTGDWESISERDFEILLEKTQSRETGEDELFYPAGDPKYDMGRAPIVELLLKSGKSDEISKAVKHCEELSLIRYFGALKNIASVQPIHTKLKVHLLLYEWMEKFPLKFYPDVSPDGLGLIKSGLVDYDFQIRKEAMSFIINNRLMIEKDLQNLLWKNLQVENYFDLITLNIMCMELTDDKEAVSDQLEDFYANKLEQMFFNWQFEVHASWEKYRGIDRPSYKKTDEKTKIMNEVEDRYKKARVQSGGWANVANSWILVSSSIGTEPLGKLILKHSKKLMEDFKVEIKKGYSIPTLNEAIDALGVMKPKKSEIFLRLLLTTAAREDVILSAIKSLSNFRDQETVMILRKYLALENQEDTENSYFIHIAASDALSRIGDEDSFDEMWRLFTLDGEKMLTTGDGMSFFSSLLRLNRERLEKKLWEVIKKNNYSVESFKLYSEFIKKCGGLYSFEQCKLLVGNKQINIDDYYNSPKGILRYLAWFKPQLREVGIKFGLEFLESNKRDLEDLGIDLAEPYFLEHPEGLEKYEKSDSEFTLYNVAMIYSKLERLDKLELLGKNSNKYIASSAVDKLIQLNPERGFKNYYMVRNNQALHLEFFVGDQTLFLNLEGAVRRSEDSECFNWGEIDAVKGIKVRKNIIGLIFIVKGKPGDYIAIVPRSAVAVHYPMGEDNLDDKGIKQVVEKIRSGLLSGSFIGEIAAAPETLYHVMEIAFLKECEIRYHRNENDESMIQWFKKEFDPQMMSLD